MALAREGQGRRDLCWGAASDCIYLANQESLTAQTGPSDTRIGFAEAVPVTGNDNEVRGFIYDKGGSSGFNGSFELAVFC